MSKYLVKYDFFSLIQETYLNEVTNVTDRLINDSIDEAVEEAAGYIRHRYDYDQVFKVVQEWSESATYKVNDRIFWSAITYDSTLTYSTDDQVSFNIGTSPVIDEKIYIANDSVAAGETPLTTPAKWDLKADNNTFYTCTVATVAGDLPTDTAKFTAGDDRNKKLKTVVVDICLYNLFSRITPKSIPTVRLIRYDGNGDKAKSENAISWLEKVQKGNITPDLPVLLDDDGESEQNTERFSYGSSPQTAYR